MEGLPYILAVVDARRPLNLTRRSLLGTAAASDVALPDAAHLRLGGPIVPVFRPAA